MRRNGRDTSWAPGATRLQAAAMHRYSSVRLAKPRRTENIQSLQKFREKDIPARRWEERDLLQPFPENNEGFSKFYSAARRDTTDMNNRWTDLKGTVPGEKSQT